MARSVTVKDIAQGAEVSIATVSRVLNNHGNVNEEVRQRVLQAAAELGYFKTAGQGAAIRSVERLPKEVGFLFCYTPKDNKSEEIDHFWAHVLYGAENEARKANIRLIYQALPRGEPSYLLQAKLHELRVNGILLVGPSEMDTIEAIQKVNIPLVLIDNYVSLPGNQVDAVLGDNYEGAKLAVSYLLSQGHHNIAYIGGYSMIDPPNSIYTFDWRKEGYCAALREAGIPVKEQLIHDCYIVDTEAIYDICRRLVACEEPVSAIFCANDPTASWAIKGLRECGVRVPEDVSVIGFDDIDIAEHVTPPLTTIRVNKEALGAWGVKTLIARIAEPQAVSMTHILGVQLVERASVVPYRRR